MAEIASKWKEADNDLQKFQLLDERTGLLEKTVPDRKIEEWVGKIIKLGISKQGDAFLSIRLSGSTSKGNQNKTKQLAKKNSDKVDENKDLTGAVFLTRDERLSDLDDKSLIPAGTPLFNLLKRFKSGDEVRFNAQLLPEMGTFIREIDAEMDSRLLNPKFVSRFEYLDKIDIPEEHLDEPLKKELSIEQPKKEEHSESTSEKVQMDIEIKDEETLTDKEVNKALEEFGEYDPKLDLGHYKHPTIDLMIEYPNSEVTVNKEELEANKNQIVETLNNYKIEISKIKATVGPTVTLYEIVPAPGVRISKIKGLENDIALSLAALGIRIIAPLPGKGTIGIEVKQFYAKM